MDRTAKIIAMMGSSSLLTEVAPKERTLFFSALDPAPLCSAGSEPASANGAPAKPRLVLSGWAMSYFVLADGKRQIIDFHLPGELLACPASGQLKTLVHTVALSDLQLADFDEFWTDDGPDLAVARSVWARMREQELERRIMRIASLGGHGGKTKVATLFLDWYHRLEKAGIAEDGLFKAPITQEILADALGLSVVHVNRIVQNLRHDGMIRMTAKEIEILDPVRLASIASVT